MIRRAALLSLIALLGCGKEPPAPVVVGKQAGSGGGEKKPVEPVAPPTDAGPIDEASKRARLVKDCEKRFQAGDTAARLDAVRDVEGGGEDGLPLLRKALIDKDRGVRIEAGAVWTRIARDTTEGVAVLVEELSRPGGTADSRVFAMQALEALGPRASAAIPALIKALALSPRESEAAIDALQAIGEESVLSVVEAARRAVDIPTRSRALKLLSQLAPLNPDAIAAMREALLHPDPVLRAAAAESLGGAAAEHDMVVDALTPFLADPDGSVRAAAGRAVRRGGRRSLRAGQALVDALRDDLAGDAIASLFCDLGPEGAPLLDAIRPLLTNRDAALAARAAIALSAMGAAATSALPDLLCAWEASLKPGSGSDSQASLRSAIIRMGDLAVLPVVELMRGSSSRETKSGCLDLLAEMSVISGDAVRALATCLKDESVREEVVGRLEKLGPMAWRTAGDLIAAERLAKTDLSRDQIYRALGAIGVRDAANVKEVREMMPRAGDRASFLLESLVTGGMDGVMCLRRFLLFDPAAPDRRQLAVEILTAMPGGLEGEVPALTGLLAHPDPEARRSAARAMCVIRKLPETAIQALAKLLDDGSPRVRRAAVVALARSEGAAAPIAARLRKCDADLDPDVRCLALLSLGSSGAEPKAEEMLLDTLLNDTRPESRAAAARAISRLRAPGKAVIPSLARALRDKSEPVVTEALIALAILRADAKFVDPELKRRDANLKSDFGAAVVWACRGEKTARAMGILVELSRAGLPESRDDIATSLLVQVGPGEPGVRSDLLEMCKGSWPGRHSFRLALASRTK
jgi:HEAT repeat protein